LRPFQSLGVASAHRDARSFVNQSLSQRQAKSIGPAGNEIDAILKF
jgi:hypothetical protein